MCANKLKESIIKNNLTIKDISDLLGISKDSAYQKTSNVKQLTIREVFLLKEFLELTDQEASIIFLGA